MLQLARALARLRAGSYLATRLSARELGIVLAGSLRSRYSDYGRGLGSEEALVDMEQKVGRWLPRRHRRAFDRAVVGVAEAGPLDVSRWRQAMVHTAHRASVVATGDILGCLEQIIRSDRRLAAAALEPHRAGRRRPHDARAGRGRLVRAQRRVRDATNAGIVIYGSP